MHRRALLRAQPARAFTMARRVVAAKKNTPLPVSPAPLAALAAETAPEQATPPGNDPAARFALHDAPLGGSTAGAIDWSDSFHGLGQEAFPKEVSDVLLADIDTADVEIKPDGLLYLPEIKYRRILNRAFGPGGWGLAPRTETYITPKQVSREYALVCNGRLVSVARGEQDYFGGEEKLTTALEGCKSNALMRCCKDLGIASELWDPSFIRKFKKEHCEDVFAEHVTTKKKKKLWKLKGNSIEYPYKQC